MLHKLNRITLADQIAEYIRNGIYDGIWTTRLPGILALSKQLSVSKDTLRQALVILEKEGVLLTCKAGKPRVISGKRLLNKDNLRVAILLEEPWQNNNAFSLEMLTGIKSSIELEGHTCIFAEKSLKKIANITDLEALVNRTQANAWIIYGGDRHTLEWFGKTQVPTLAIGGRCTGLPIASTYTDITNAMTNTVDLIVNKGHRRIVLVCGSVWREPSPGISAQIFINRLRFHGIKTSGFNIPSWVESPSGFHELMSSLFATTPPSALIFTEPNFCVAGLIFLAQNNLRVPNDVSVVSILPEPSLSLHKPVIAHFEWTTNLIIDHCVTWTKRVHRGLKDNKSKIFRATLNKGESIGKYHPFK